VPHVTEEVYQTMYTDDMAYRSIHVSHWPKPRKNLIEEEAEKYGDLVVAVIEEIRRDKAERRMSLNTPIKKLTIYAGTQKSAHVLNHAVQDIEGTCKTQKMTVLAQSGDGREVQEYSSVRFVAEY